MAGDAAKCRRRIHVKRRPRNDYTVNKIEYLIFTFNYYLLVIKGILTMQHFFFRFLKKSRNTLPLSFMTNLLHSPILHGRNIRFEADERREREQKKNETVSNRPGWPNGLRSVPITSNSGRYKRNNDTHYETECTPSGENHRYVRRLRFWILFCQMVYRRWFECRCGKCYVPARVCVFVCVFAPRNTI